MFIQGGVCQTAGLFFVIFMEVFDESRGYVALITSVNFGVNCMIGKYSQGVLTKGSGNVACSPLALHCGGKSYLGAQLDKEGGHLA